MRLLVCTLAAIALLVSATSLLRLHALSGRILFLERQLAEAPPQVQVIRVPEPALTAVATSSPPAPRVAPHKSPTRLARTLPKPRVDPPKCSDTDPTCGIDR